MDSQVEKISNTIKAIDDIAEALYLETLNLQGILDKIKTNHKAKRSIEVFMLDEAQKN